MADLTLKILENMNRKEIQAMCKQYKIKANGKTTQMIEELLAMFSQTAVPTSDNMSDSTTMQEAIPTVQDSNFGNHSLVGVTSTVESSGVTTASNVLEQINHVRPTDAAPMLSVTPKNLPNNEPVESTLNEQGWMPSSVYSTPSPTFHDACTETPTATQQSAIQINHVSPSDAAPMLNVTPKNVPNNESILNGQGWMPPSVYSTPSLTSSIQEWKSSCKQICKDNETNVHPAIPSTPTPTCFDSSCLVSASPTIDPSILEKINSRLAQQGIVVPKEHTISKGTNIPRLKGQWPVLGTVGIASYRKTKINKHDSIQAVAARKLENLEKMKKNDAKYARIHQLSQPKTPKLQHARPNSENKISTGGAASKFQAPNKMNHSVPFPKIGLPMKKTTPALIPAVKIQKGLKLNLHCNNKLNSVNQLAQ